MWGAYAVKGAAASGEGFMTGVAGKLIAATVVIAGLAFGLDYLGVIDLPWF